MSGFFKVRCWKRRSVGGRQTLRCRCQRLEKKLLLLQCFPIIRSAMRRYRNKLYPSCLIVALFRGKHKKFYARGIVRSEKRETPVFCAVLKKSRYSRFLCRLDSAVKQQTSLAHHPHAFFRDAFFFFAADEVFWPGVFYREEGFFFLYLALEVL